MILRYKLKYVAIQNQTQDLIILKLLISKSFTNIVMRLPLSAES